MAEKIVMSINEQLFARSQRSEGSVCTAKELPSDAKSRSAALFFDLSIDGSGTTPEINHVTQTSYQTHSECGAPSQYLYSDSFGAACEYFHRVMKFKPNIFNQ